ncbi:hypothetical protein FC756_22100 [Lysinibacillus mangiferihumi]|uniref:Lipocalin-like domain-containing protein n=1 Tax=Lysinibacillus mangiferihumi TaxID=1130819 RepID=A0A4U2Y2F7_9BACI|nr:hypothetical protein [Lysinibacillus mangiferihumi]TKI53732.1 hypothetical protein FC756_22100 [Lysinibacillus mangiferihumi]
MKKRTVLLFLVVTTILLTACSEGRDISSVETAIFGHWVSESEDPELGDTHYYISGEKFIMVDGGTKSIMDYTVSSTNEEEKWIEIITEGKKGSGSLVRRLEFANDDMTKIVYPIKMSDVIVSSDRADSKDTQELFDFAENVLGETEIKSTWKYVDGLTEPKK